MQALPFTNKYSLYSSNSSNVYEPVYRSDNALNKKKRQLLTQTQTDKLKMYYCKEPYPSAEVISLISKDIGVDVKKVANWFVYQRQQNKAITFKLSK